MDTFTVNSGDVLGHLSYSAVCGNAHLVITGIQSDQTEHI